MSDNSLQGKWALILGASSGFGAATARELASRGMNIFGVHLDMKMTMPPRAGSYRRYRGHRQQGHLLQYECHQSPANGREPSLK